jgi:hypothetical protein
MTRSVGEEGAGFVYKEGKTAEMRGRDIAVERLYTIIFEFVKKVKLSR